MPSISEAAFVRTLFRRYLELGSVVRLKEALDAEGVASPVRMTGTGNGPAAPRCPEASVLDPVEPDLRGPASP